MSYLLLFLRQPWFRQRSLTWFLYVHCLSCFLRGGTRVSATVGQNDSGQCSETGGTGWHSAFWGVLMRCSSAALGSWSFFIWIFIVRILAKSVHFLLYILTQCLFFRLPQSKFDVAIFRECLDLLLFQAIVLWEVDQGHIWRASILRTPRARPPIKGQYSPNTKSQATDEGPVFSEHQEPGHRLRANILRTPKPDHRWRASILRTPKLNFPTLLEGKLILWARHVK